MTKGEILLPEFDQEMANTRKVLERIPDEQWDWQPHEKSPTLGWLAVHLARLASWVPMTLTQDFFDVAAPGALNQFTDIHSRQSALELFDVNATAARAALAAISDSDIMQPWSLKAGDTVYFTHPRIAVLRFFVLNHLIHHRAQLGMYLRLLDVPLPPIYGPTADEPM